MFSVTFLHFKQYDFILNIAHKIILSFFVKLFGEKRFVCSVKVLPASIKLIKPIQKYPHIIESYACIRKIFVFMFLLIRNVLFEYVLPQNYQNK